MSTDASDTAPGALSSAPLRLNLDLVSVVVGMLLLSATLFASYFMLWSHYYLPGGQAWPLADPEFARAYYPWNWVTQGGSGFSVVGLCVLLAGPAPYVIFGALGAWASGGWRRLCGILSLIAAIFALLLASLALLGAVVGPQFCDCAESSSIDVGAWVGFPASLLMAILAIVFLRQKDKLFRPDPLR